MLIRVFIYVVHQLMILAYRIHIVLKLGFASMYIIKTQIHIFKLRA